MKARLTLRLNEEVIEAAKRYAREHDTSLSKLVERFFQHLQGTSEAELTPHVRSLLGLLEGAEIDEDAYREHLVDKYL